MNKINKINKKFVIPARHLAFLQKQESIADTFSKIKIFLALFLLIFTCSSLTAQDYKLSLSKGIIRYDADSGFFKFNYPIRRELGAALFQVNPQQFTWNTSTGLNLQPLKLDSFTTIRPTVIADTGDGEFSPYKVRAYTIKKPTYANFYSPWELMVKYRSYNAGTLESHDSAWLVNDSYVSNESHEPVELDESIQTIRTVYYPKPGLYQTTVEFVYEFGYGNADQDCYDSIKVGYGYYPLGDPVIYTTVKYSYYHDTKAGNQGIASFTLLVNVLGGYLTTPYSFVASASDATHTGRLIKYYKISHILIR